MMLLLLLKEVPISINTIRTYNSTESIGTENGTVAARGLSHWEFNRKLKKEKKNPVLKYFPKI